jgi:phosphatidylserine decarboxylase
MKRRAIDEAGGILTGLGAGFLAAVVCRRRGLAWLLGGLIGYTFYFFRDPERGVLPDGSLGVAPADGRVVDIEEVNEPYYLGRRMLRIGIFLSVFDVHVNRAPIAGRVVFSQAKSGRYLDARHPGCSTYNASRLWVIEGDRVTVAVRQISGAIARRICAWAEVGDTLEQGERFGMIRFGSRTELYVPVGSEVLVKVGDRVQAGLSPLVRLG